MKRPLPGWVRFARLYVVEQDGTRLRFECKEHGHTHWLDYGPDAPLKRRIATQLIERFAKYWSREGGGCQGACPGCARLARKEQANVR